MTDAKPAIILAISRAPDANIIETVDRIRAELPAGRISRPRFQLNVAQDRSPTIRASLAEVEQSLAIAIGLVIGGVHLPRSGRATLISGRRAGVAGRLVRRHVSVRVQPQ